MTSLFRRGFTTVDVRRDESWEEYGKDLSSNAGSTGHTIPCPESKLAKELRFGKDSSNDVLYERDPRGFTILESKCEF